MITNGKATEVISAMSTALRESIAEYLKNHADNITSLDYETARDKVSGLLADMRSIVGGTHYEGYSYPRYVATFVSYEEGGKLSSLTLSVQSGLKAKTKVNGKQDITVDANFAENLLTAIANEVDYLLQLEVANDNLADFNGMLDDLLSDTGVKVNFSISDKYIESITDSEVVFGVPVESALGVSKMGMAYFPDDSDEAVAVETAVEPEVEATEPTAEVAETEEVAESAETPAEVAEPVEEVDPDGFVKMLIQENQAKFVDAVSGRTTPQILKTKIALVEAMTGVTTVRRADKLIRMTYHRKADYVKGMKKDGIGYVEKTIKVDGEDIDIFALVQKTGDELSVALSPFNIKTSFSVDCDVLADLK